MVQQNTATDPRSTDTPVRAVGDDDAVAERLARLAHELRMPLSAIASAADIMQAERLGPIGDERYRGYAGDILENARHALGVIERMLTIVPPEEQAHRGQKVAGEKLGTAPWPSALVFTELDINDQIDRLASSMRTLFDEAGIEPAMDLAPGLPHIIADPVTLRQMLLNLISNALRATQAGGRITLSTSYMPPGPLHITVTDTGSGMDDVELARRLQAAGSGFGAAKRTEGHGLGLPIVGRLAELNGARLLIDSQLGRGTQATIAFEPSRIVPV